MKFGASIASYTTTWDSIEATVKTMEAGRFGSVWFPDHFIPPSKWKGGEDQPIFESWTLLSAVAGSTSKLRMGHMVNGNTYRNPALVAKMATTIDQISHGRFVLSHGAAWFEREHLAYGWDFPSLRERSDRFEESCHLLKKLLQSSEPVSFDGVYYQLDSAPLSPGSFQKPSIPIMVGGMGERRTLKTLAKYGDIWNLDGFAVGKPENAALGGMSVGLFRHKVDVIHRHCETINRDPNDIKLTISMPIKISSDEHSNKEFVANVGPGTLAGSKSYLVQRIGEFLEAGVDEIMFSPRPSTPESLQELDEEILASFE